MSSTTTKTLRVNCGDTAIIPTGAKNIKVIKNGVITLNSECIDLSNESTLDCYSVVFAESNASGGIQAYEDIILKGIVFEGVEYPFSSDIGLSLSGFPGPIVASPTAADFVTALVNTLSSLNGLLIQPCVVLKADSDRGDAYGYIFKTTSDIASKLQVIVEATEIGGGAGSYRYYAPVLSVSTQPAFAGSWDPTCGCKTS